MGGRKQVMDMRSEKDGISAKESDEQQRNWTAEKWEKKAKESLSNYDPTRARLNFEVVKGGIVQPIDTSKTIAQKMAENLAARGIKDPNARPNAKRKQRTLAKFIFGGSRERMRQMAFGDQTVDSKKGADNSMIVRSKDVEDWARDVYNFVARHFGEDNIIGFYVHLDEMNPHIHCTVVPVDDRNRISWTGVFGKNRFEESASMTNLHNALIAEVSSKWGLERGSNSAETQAKHRSTEEYKRELVNDVNDLENAREGLLKQIHRAEIKLKGISTMITNLQERKEKVQAEIDAIAAQFGQEGCDNAELAHKMAGLRRQLEGIDQKISERQRMLDDANTTLKEARSKLAEMKMEQTFIKEHLDNDTEKLVGKVQSNITATYNKMVSQSLEPIMSTLSPSQQDLLDDTGYTDMTQNCEGIITCAVLLAMGYIKEATNYAESCGGSSSNLSGWGRKKDDDDEHWWMKCITQSTAMMRPAKRKYKRSR